MIAEDLAICRIGHVRVLRRPGGKELVRFRKRVLVVDDDEDTCAMIADILQEDGYGFIPAWTAKKHGVFLSRSRSTWSWPISRCHGFRAWTC